MPQGNKRDSALFQGVQGGQSVSAGQQADKIGTQEVASLVHGHSLSIAAADHSPGCVHEQRFQTATIGYLQAAFSGPKLHIVLFTSSNRNI